MSRVALDAYRMPFTPGRRFKARPRRVAGAQGLERRTPEGREVLDGTSGGGLADNRRAFGGVGPRADRLRSTWDPPAPAFVRGQPETGAGITDELEPRVVGIRETGLAAGIDLAPIPGAPGPRGAAAQAAAFGHGAPTRAPGDTRILAPPFVSTGHDVARMAARPRAAIVDTAHPPQGSP